MLSNRSVPTNTMLSHLTYEDVPAAIAWLTESFGFTEHYHYGDPAQGAQMHYGDAWFMLASSREGRSSPTQSGTWTQMLTIFVEDVDAHYAQSKSKNLTIIEELQETFYGERQYVVEDLSGHPWLFSQHIKDIAPEEWGAIISNHL